MDRGDGEEIREDKEKVKQYNHVDDESGDRVGISW